MPPTRRPSAGDLPPRLAAAARGVARRLAAHGTRAWLVGGAVRDLALGREAKDVDLASAARPEEVEALFGTVHEVGKAFGTCVVSFAGVDVQVTTFRTETGYADARRPDEVRYAGTPEEDARRRDFTCNAVYLDPLTDEVLDPCGGLADLGARVLRCVGEPRRRFAEDGLRLLRLARFAAAYDLAIDPGTRAGAEESLEALRGVSAERVLAELVALSRSHGTARGWAELLFLGVLERLPGFADPPPVGRATLAPRVELLGRLPEPLPASLALAVVLAADGVERPEEPRGTDGAERGAEGTDGGLEARLLSLRAPRRLVAEALGTRRLARRLAALLAREAAAGGAGMERAERLRVLRDPAFAAAAAWVAAAGGEGRRARLVELEAWGGALSAEERRPTPWITSADLAGTGLAPGPRWGELLEEAETRRLEGRDRTRAEALAWLAREVGSGGVSRSSGRREDAPQPERER